MVDKIKVDENRFYKIETQGRFTKVTANDGGRSTTIRMEASDSDVIAVGTHQQLVSAYREKVENDPKYGNNLRDISYDDLLDRYDKESNKLSVILKRNPPRVLDGDVDIIRRLKDIMGEFLRRDPFDVQVRKLFEGTKISLSAVEKLEKLRKEFDDLG